jgi:UDP-glucose 4-epimerase
MPDPTSARCLVTGGAGFIGSNVVRALLAAGARVTVLDDFSTGKAEHLPASPDLEVVRADLANSPDLAAVVAEHEYVFHLAAQVSTMRSLDVTEDDARRNILGSVRLYSACRGTRIRRLVYSSSCAIFGEPERLPVDEEHPQRPASFYALSKQTAEKYALLEAALRGLPAVCLRYFNVYGLPIQQSDYTGVISIFSSRLLADQPLVVYGDGSQSRDFVYVDDVVQANLLAAERGRNGRAYNVGTGERTTILALAQALGELAGVRPRIVFQPWRPGELRASVADVTRAREELGYRPAYDLRRGLAELWRGLPR